MPSKPPAADSPFWTVFHLGTRLHLAMFRASKGRVGGRLGRAPILILSHVGRKSGRPRRSPLIYLEDGPRVVVVASKGGTDTHPAWYHNLMAMESTDVQLPRQSRHRVRPRVARGREREELWPRLVNLYKGYGDYASFTDRQIPVVVLEPV